MKNHFKLMFSYMIIILIIGLTIINNFSKIDNYKTIDSKQIKSQYILEYGNDNL